MKNCFQSPLEGHSETSTDRAPLNRFNHYIKIKGYMRVLGGGGTLYPRVDCPPLPHCQGSQGRDREKLGPGRDRRNCFQSPLEGHSESSNDQAFIIT